MSFRSPTPDGLTFPPNAAGFPNNPAANPQELQSHHYWGRYDAVTNLPNIGFLDGVAVAGTNPAAVPAYDKLAPGDFGFVEGAGPPALSNMYVCTDRGTVSGNNAYWITLGNTSVVQTIRDAHVIVVAQGGVAPTLATLSGDPSGDNAANNFNLQGPATGDVVSVTCDYLDPGDGSELQFALNAAASAGVPVDVRLRPCDIILTDTTAPLVMSSTRLIGAGGAGVASSGITGTDGTAASTQTVIEMSASSLEDLVITSPAPTVGPGGTIDNGVVQMDGGQVIRRCVVSLARATGEGLGRLQTAAIRSIGIQSRLLVEDCELLVDSLSTQNVAAASYGVRASRAIMAAEEFDAEVRNTTIDRKSKAAGVGSCQHAIFFKDIEGGRFSNIEQRNCQASNSILAEAFHWEWSTPLTGGAHVRGPQFHDCRVSFTDDETASATGFIVSVGGTQNIAGVYGTEMHDCRVRFIPNETPSGAITKEAFKLVQSGTNTNGDLSDSTLDNCKAFGAHRGIVIQCSGAGVFASIISVRVQSCQARDTLGTGSAPARGMIIIGGQENTNPNVLDVGVHNCDFGNAALAGTGIGLEIFNSWVDDTIVLGNNLKTLSGLAVDALVDLGTGTEAAHNILT